MFVLNELLEQKLTKLSLVCLVLGCLSFANPQLAKAAQLETSTLSLTFTGVEGGPNPPNQTLSITNTGGRALKWTVGESTAWLNLSPTSGTTTTETDVITVSVNTAGLTAGTYSSTITINAHKATTQTQQVAVMLTVTSPSPVIGESPTSLSFIMTQGWTNSESQTLTITNTGKGTLSWSASGATSWMTLNPTSGALTAGQSNAVTVTVNPTGLSTNIYTAPVTIIAPGATNTPQQVLVTLAISAPASGTATLTWDAETDPTVIGYKVYSGTTSAAYGSPVDVGNVTSFKVINLTPGKTYFFAVTAYNNAGYESSYSNEVSKAVN